MKVILSRKGFDSASGKLCNPILPDGTLLSMPIPGESRHPVHYDDLTYNVKDSEGKPHVMSYEDILSQLGGEKWVTGQQCHLDPDLRSEIMEREEGWVSAFGQCDNAKKFLDEMDISEGDLFLFFGRFRQTEFSKDGKIQYVRNAPEQHIIYGYMQVGKIIHNTEIDKEFKWHPHAENGKENNLYLPAESLSINPDMPGVGILPYSYKRVLTGFGMKISKWKLPDFIRGLDFRVETRKEELFDKFYDAPDGQEYFQFIGRGQEFVLSVHESDMYAKFYRKSLEEWAYSMLIDNVCDKTIERLRNEKLDYDFENIEKVENIINGVIKDDKSGQLSETYPSQMAYCRFHHRIMQFDEKRCTWCPLKRSSGNGKCADCLYDVPIKQGAPMEIPCAPRDRFAFYEILIQKGIVQRKDISWDMV